MSVKCQIGAALASLLIAAAAVLGIVAGPDEPDVLVAVAAATAADPDGDGQDQPADWPW